MPKNNCSCANDSEIEYTNEAPTFRTHFLLDNAFIPVFNNPSRTLINLVQNGAPNSLVDRANWVSCDDSVTTQDKLKVRKKDRPTPYRVPFNHFRKVTSCKSDCITNVKLNKDSSCNNVDCFPTTYALSRLVDKNGVRNLNNGGNYKNYLQSSGKNYYLNSAGILPESAVSGKLHTYKIGSIENTVLNKNSGTEIYTDCQLGYSYTTSQNDKSFSLTKMNTTTKKYSNPYHKTSGSVSSKAHIHKKKFRNILAGQSLGKKDGYNNCRNGEFCSLYMKPGPNTKLFMGKTSKQRCIPPRIRGMKQSCPVPPPTCEGNKIINPRFERNEYFETFDNNGYLKITIDHCKLEPDDIILIKFLGYSTTIQPIFTPTTDTLAVNSIDSSITIDDSGIINLNITELYVNKNSIYWVMPVSVGEGTTTIILNDGGNDSIINNTNGPSGLIYATVTIPRHFTANSVTAWSLTAIDPCYYRQLNGIGAITSFTTLGGAFLPIGTFVNASVPNGTTHNPEDLLMQFTISNEDFIQGDIFTIDFYTSSSFGTGFLNATNYPNGITNWNLNPIPQAGQEYNPGTTIPTLLLIKMDISDINNPQLTYNANYFSSASWTGTSQVNLNGSIYYKQTLSITIGNSPPTTTSNNEVYYFYIIRAEQTIGQQTTYTSLFSNHPTIAGDVKYAISCNCYTGTGITNGYGFGSPCSTVPSNSAFTNSVMSIVDWDNTTAPPETLITTYTGGLSPDIVKFTFTLSHAGNQNNQGLTKGDVIVFRITTDYGDQSSGFFIASETDLNDSQTFDWQLNKRPEFNDFSFISIWLEQNGNVLDAPLNGSGNGIESITFANSTFNTNTNVYSQFLYVTIGKTIESIAPAQGALTLGIYAGLASNDIISTFPSNAYNISYEIDSYCWATTGNQSDISLDPCGGRSGSFTNSSLEATGFGQDTGTLEASDTIRICSIEFTATNEALIGGDTLILKLITSYTTATNTTDGFFTEDVTSDITKNSTSYPTSGGLAIWISQGASGYTPPVANMIDSLSMAVSTNDTGTSFEYIQTLSIDLSGTSIYGTAGTTWKINISGGNGTTADITPLPSTAGYIKYDLDLNCFTGTGLQSGTSWTTPPSLTNLSLIPNNFGGYPNQNGLPGPGTTDTTMENPAAIMYINDSFEDSKGRKVVLRFTNQYALSGGATIKLTVKKPIPSGTSIASAQHPIFYRNETTTPPSFPPWDDITGNYNAVTVPDVIVWGQTTPSIGIKDNISISAYNSTTDTQDVTIELDNGASIAANSTVEVWYYDDDGSYGHDIWRDNTEDGQEVTFDLEVSGHDAVTNQFGWFVQDISGDNLETTAGDPVFKAVTSNASQSNVSNIIYRHYCAIPQNSYIIIYFHTDTLSFFDYTGWQSNITNNAFNVASGKFGISVREKDLNNSNTDNDIALSDFGVGQFYPAQNPYEANIQYIKFKINESGGISGGTGKYIEIYMNDNGIFQNNDGSPNGMYTGQLKVSIELRSSWSPHATYGWDPNYGSNDNPPTGWFNDTNLLGSVFMQNMGVNQPFNEGEEGGL